jgi:hypothetical protein
MKRVIQILALFMVCIPTLLRAQEDQKYLVGAVPEIEGKVVFSVVYEMPGLDKQAVYKKAYGWLEERMKKNENDSRIVFADEENGEIAAMGGEYLIFKSNAFLLDRAHMTYLVEIYCSPGKCEMQLERIRYDYDHKKFTAEEYITDAVALNKTKTTIYRGYKKFRIKTVDFSEEMFDDAYHFFSIKKEEPKKEPEKTKSSVRVIE